MRKYTKKDARNYSAAYTDPTRLAQEKRKEHELHVASIKHFKGEEPELPEGVTKYSEEGLKLYKKAAEKAAEAQSRRKFEQKKREEEAKEARLRGARRRSPPTRPTLGRTRVEKPTRRRGRTDAREQSVTETVGRTLKRVLRSRSVPTATQVPDTVRVLRSRSRSRLTGRQSRDTVTNGARVVNIRGRQLICDSDDEDGLQLIPKNGGTKATKANEDNVPGKRTIVSSPPEDRHKQRN